MGYASGQLVKIDSGIALNAMHYVAMDLENRYKYWGGRVWELSKREDSAANREAACTAARFQGEILGRLYRLQEERDAVIRQLGGRPHPQEVK